MEMQQFQYDNKIVKNFLYATMLWGVVGMLVGLLLAFMFLFPNLLETLSVIVYWDFNPKGGAIIELTYKTNSPAHEFGIVLRYV